MSAIAPTPTSIPAPSAHGAFPVPQPLLNDFVLTVATVNGSGSQSANAVLFRAIFQMGVPVSGKSIFPSNIQGLPTWYTLRVNKEGWIARRADVDLLVALNPESVAEDLRALPSGASVILHSDLKSMLKRDDLKVHIVPFGELVAQVCPEVRLRKLVSNMVYVGVVGWLLGIELEEIQKAIVQQFGKKSKAIELNRNAANLGYNWSAEHLQNDRMLQIRRMDANRGKILIEGNAACSLGFLFGGVTVVGWYPITPSSSVIDNLAALLSRYRHDPETGKATYAVVQAEDEIAAIGFVLGAGWAGARAMTATSGPGISLMAEMAGLAYFAEIPAVIVDVQRVGPSTGLPTRTGQQDILKAHFLSHGDCRHPLLIPADPKEAYEFAALSLDLAERLQTLVFLMSDLDLGMNLWSAPRFAYPEKPMDRGKVLSAADLERLKKFERYRDVDGDGIPYRTLPGTRHPLAGYFTRGTGHTPAATYSEKTADWTENLDRLAKKFRAAADLLPAPVVEVESKGDVGLIAYGTSDMAVKEALDLLRREDGDAPGYLRLRGVPFSDAVRRYLERHRIVHVVEQNRDAQLTTLLRMDFPEFASRLRPLLHYDGMPLDAKSVVQKLRQARA
ncbi:MAG: 2-oxoacid:acceptor oxidoreductase subunit alpha [Verrucomicrobiae bacterium]|nr:2-oxoacid:acceptor oxidoreductase subunit alpha [Verrucomicrobiae bacterium]